MKKLLFPIFLLAIAFQFLPAQSPAVFTVTLEEVSFPNLPGVQSYAWGQANGKWLLLGGRTDGLHIRQPHSSFLASDNNTNAIVIDPATGQYWTQNLNMLPTGMEEQLQSTNPNFYQRGNTLYIIGGYGYSATSQDHITYGNLVAVDVPGAINAIVANTSMASHFRQISYPAFTVSGGHLGYLDSTFYLVGGQNFIGRYNPHGPTHGPGFFQEYTDEIRTFRIQDDGTNLTITNYSAVHDSALLHRRDYNMTPTIFPNNDYGFQIFSGVFQHTVDLPWLDLVDVRPGGSYQQVPGFQQLLNQYHGAKMPVYDAGGSTMHHYFFGGMARFYFDANDNLIDDTNVPFVKTISKVTRYPNDSLVEYDTGEEMPGFLGSGAEFIPLPSAPYLSGEILDLASLPTGSNHVGYVFGGIESSADNIFFVNTGTQSWASNRLFKVMVNVVTTSVTDPEIADVGFEALYDRAARRIRLRVRTDEKASFSLRMTDIAGRTIRKKEGQMGPGQLVEENWSVSGLPTGVYFLTLYTGEQRKTVRVRID